MANEILGSELALLVEANSDPVPETNFSNNVSKEAKVLKSQAIPMLEEMMKEEGVGSGAL